ncbi:MAG: DUF3343 domain-containing protein [Oscillospiraceae bacterium]|nr:DUF3343 domain-containing protein [Oscillospiraceae bacterium]
MAPVPRELSASCGVCVRVETACAPDLSKHEDMECCYSVSENGTYTPYTTSSDSPLTSEEGVK